MLILTNVKEMGPLIWVQGVVPDGSQLGGEANGHRLYSLEKKRMVTTPTLNRTHNSVGGMSLHRRR